MLRIRLVAPALAFFTFFAFLFAAQPRIHPAISIRTIARQAVAPALDEDGADAESEAAGAYHVTVLDLFNHENFAQLEDIGDDARSQKSRFRGGGWKLAAFYGAISSPGSGTATDAEWKAHFERLQRWIAFRPDSSTPRVALADSYLRFAWKARGSGTSDTVTPEGRKLFFDRAEKAREILEKAKSLSTSDPHWFLVMHKVSRAQEWTPQQAKQLLEEAYNVEPNYYYFYDSYAFSLLPRWYGKPGDSEAFAESIADRVGTSEGDVIYFNIALHENCCKARPQMPALSWDRVKQGFASSEQLYRSTNFQRNAMAYMAVRGGDKEFAQQIFGRIGDNWSKRVWREKRNFDYAKDSLSLRPVTPHPTTPSTDE